MAEGQIQTGAVAVDASSYPAAGFDVVASVGAAFAAEAASDGDRAAGETFHLPILVDRAFAAASFLRERGKSFYFFLFNIEISTKLVVIRNYVLETK